MCDVRNEALCSICWTVCTCGDSFLVLIFQTDKILIFCFFIIPAHTLFQISRLFNLEKL